ncbi:hypothetical protein T484DRAFT_1764434 [Baffinella frigidus]|nr:hypothetical protein T484DRAFT_1764434 [Cryptophyta sp. CCMP2293]
MKAELEEAVALEDFSRAAQARDALQPLLVDADRSKMLSTLQNSIEVKRAELRLLHVQLEEAVNGEDFERAEEVFAHISEIERKKMYAALQKVQEEGALQNERLERGAGGLGAPPPAKLAHRASFSGVIWPLKMISSVQNGSEAPGRGSKALARPAAMTLGGAALQLVEDPPAGKMEWTLGGAALQLVEDAPAGKMEWELVMFFLAICSISSVPFFLIQKVMTDLSLS